ncbi:MAG: hypothetical protein HS100_07795 [Anaerolineales bacterium]|nr:hypothetical protein [Anaerolineales bacterium]
MLGWKRVPKDYLEDISQMITEMGLKPIRRENESLQVYCVSKNGSGFYVRFFMHEGELVFESPFKKSAHGTSENVAAFNQALLAYNTKMTKLSFSLAKGRDGWVILLRGAGEYKTVTPDFLYNIFNYFNFVYTTFIPEIEDMATEWNIKFNGNSLIDDMF